jgi:hypothetical protein
MEISQLMINREQILSIPFWEMAAVLRGLMGDICADVLSLNRTSPRPNLLEFLGKQPMISSLGATRENGTRPDRSLVSDLDSFKAIVQGYLGGRSSPDDFQRALIKRELVSLTFEDYDILPRMYWGLAAQGAWLSPEFQEEIGYKTCSWLRSSIFLDAGGLGTPTFSANTFWSLLIMLKTISSPAQMPGNRPSSAVREGGPEEIEKALHSAAVEEAYVPGWAGFWDQWLLAKALAAWLPVPEPAMKAFYKALFDLPAIKKDIPYVVENYASKYKWQELTTLKLGRTIKSVEVPDWFRISISQKNKGRK